MNNLSVSTNQNSIFTLGYTIPKQNYYNGVDGYEPSYFTTVKEPKMAGSGIVDTLFEVKNKVTNLLPASDKNATIQYKGEKHMPLKLPNGKMGVASYAGPGTNLVKRIVEPMEQGRDADKPRTLTDKVAQAHDARYAVAANSQDQRQADIKFINKLKYLEEKKLDSKINTMAARKIIEGKMKLEDLGLVKNDTFAKIGGDYTEKQLEMIKKKLKQLEQEGYGMASLKKKALKKLIKTKAKKDKCGCETIKIKLISGGRLNSKGTEVFKNFMVNKVMPKVINDMKGEGYKDLVPWNGVKDQFSSILDKQIGKNYKAPKLVLKMAGSGSNFLTRYFGQVKDKLRGSGILDKIKLKIADGLIWFGNKLGLNPFSKMKGSGYSWEDFNDDVSDFGEGFQLGFNKTKNLVKDLGIPKVSDLAGKIPDIGGPSSMDELRANVNRRRRAKALRKAADRNREQADVDTSKQQIDTLGKRLRGENTAVSSTDRATIKGVIDASTPALDRSRQAQRQAFNDLYNKTFKGGSLETSSELKKISESIINKLKNTNVKPEGLLSKIKKYLPSLGTAALVSVAILVGKKLYNLGSKKMGELLFNQIADSSKSIFQEMRRDAEKKKYNGAGIYTAGGSIKTAGGSIKTAGGGIRTAGGCLTVKPFSIK